LLEQFLVLFRIQHTFGTAKRFASSEISKYDPDKRIVGTPEEWNSEIYDQSFYEYRRPLSGDTTNRAFVYTLNGAGKMVYASIARAAVIRFIWLMAPAADVLAMSKVEMDLSKIEVGQSIVAKWQGKPVFIRRRTPEEIKKAKADDNTPMRDPEKDEKRHKDPNWVIVIGVCTHLGCIPMPNAGDYNGWFCPCHGSHYDLSARIRKGPAPLNLEVPPYVFDEPTKITVG